MLDIAAGLVALIMGWACVAAGASESESRPAPRVVVEVEEEVYSYQEAQNGAGPMWSFGSSCIARIGDQVFISGLQRLPGAIPLNNVRWQLYRRGDRGWELAAQGEGRTREPCPVCCFQDGSLFLSDNPTLSGPDEASGPARPTLLRFDAANPTAPPEVILPEWEGEPPFTEHSYRSFAADAERRELILFQNIGYTHAEWAFRDNSGKWSAHGKLVWPWGAGYPQPQPVRVCYPTVALRDRHVYFCGVSDIVEPYPEWRAFKRELTGRDWDYDFRRLFFTWSDDITTGRFHEWVEVSSRDATCGWIFPCDLWVAPDGAVHLLWTERALDERLRERFFPGELQRQALMYAVLRDGAVVVKRALHEAVEGRSDEIPGRGRFHVTEDGRLFVIWYAGGRDAAGRRVSENRVIEILPDGTQTQAAVVPLAAPFDSFYTAGWRNGSPPSHVVDLYGTRPGEDGKLWYARIRIE